jgi:hypothetical protein
MALQIRAQKTIQLVEQLSHLTGESAETVVEVALQERLARLRAVEARMARRAELQAVVDRLASRFKEPYRSLDPGEWLYGEDGLPR